MMPSTEFEPKQIAKAGADIKALSNEMYQLLKNIEQTVNDSSEYFISDAANSVRGKFNQSAAKFDEFKMFMNSFGQYLEDFSAGVIGAYIKIQELMESFPVL